MDPSRIQIRGPLAEYVGGLWNALTAAGYTPLSTANLARVMAHMSHWLEDERLTPRAFDDGQVDRFLRNRREAGYTCWRSKPGLEPILGYLRRCGAIPMAEAPQRTPSVIDRYLEPYVEYLEKERALSATTVRWYERVARTFLELHSGVNALTAKQVGAFVLSASHSGSIGTTKLKVTALRSLLRYLHMRADTAVDLSAAVPAVAGWRLATLPKALQPEQVRRLLGAWDRRTHVGRRGFAIVLAMVRLGLRACEVAALALDDIGWSRGELVVRGKGNQVDRLPLPADVGAAIASYARRSRPRVADRHVFLRVRAPQGPLTAEAVKGIVTTGCSRAGLERIGAHRLRHTAATEMLRAGASLSDIAQVLRHRHVDTTAIYAKVDHTSLRSLCLPWPGGDR